MNPCLSGWDKGEAKHSYMHHCHGVLSRSQLNAVAKMRDAGILNSNLVVLPSLSNISLANNGTHLKMGSRLLSSGLAGGKPVITRQMKNLSVIWQSRSLNIFFLSSSARTAQPRIESIFRIPSGESPRISPP